MTAQKQDLAVSEPAALLEQVVIQGDLSNLSPAERLSYYQQVCKSLGLNPLTKPFAYLNLGHNEKTDQGWRWVDKVVLYALRDATDQLRKLRGITVTITGRETSEDIYIVTARATDQHGRSDESIGAVPIAGLKGEARANALMKAETKAKRRVTLSIAGLGWLDETEVDSVPDAKVVFVQEMDGTQNVPPITDADPPLAQASVFNAMAAIRESLKVWNADIRSGAQSGLLIPADAVRPRVEYKYSRKLEYLTPEQTAEVCKAIAQGLFLGWPTEAKSKPAVPTPEARP